jgi:deazaflavin-dependent oxidoreductase (nitroreductase family)
MSDPRLPNHIPDWVRGHLRRYLESNGADGHLWNSGVAGLLPTLLLTTTGRKSKQQLVVPLIYGKTEKRYVIVASKGGASSHPAWYLNLSADPDVEVQIGSEKFAARARTASGAERTALWKQMAANFPPYDDYQRRTKREIPVVVLEPSDT